MLGRLHRELGHVVVDEFQDLSPVQYELLRLVVTGRAADAAAAPAAGTAPAAGPASGAGDGGRGRHVIQLMCAGDDDQSIYAWRGVSALQNMRRFKLDFEVRAYCRIWSSTIARDEEGEGEGGGIKDAGEG